MGTGMARRSGGAAEVTTSRGFRRVVGAYEGMHPATRRRSDEAMERRGVCDVMWCDAMRGALGEAR